MFLTQSVVRGWDECIVDLWKIIARARRRGCMGWCMLPAFIRVECDVLNVEILDQELGRAIGSQIKAGNTLSLPNRVAPRGPKSICFQLSHLTKQVDKSSSARKP
ncbi:hypothetical protein WAI453_001077 [Rhynchosporium graminicola]